MLSSRLRKYQYAILIPFHFEHWLYFNIIHACNSKWRVTYENISAHWATIKYAYKWTKFSILTILHKRNRMRGRNWKMLKKFTLLQWMAPKCRVQQYILLQIEHHYYRQTAATECRNQFTTHTHTDLSCHHQSTCSRVNGDIASHQTNVLEFLKQLTVLLVTQRLDWCCVDHSLFIPQWHGHSVPAAWCHHNVLKLSREHSQTVTQW